MAFALLGAAAAAAVAAPEQAPSDVATSLSARAASSPAAAAPSIGSSTRASISPSLSLDELVDRVLVAQPDLRLAMLAVEGAQAAVVTARALPNPRIDFQSGRDRPPTAVASGSTSQVLLAQPLENPWLRQSRRAAAEAGVDVARAQQSVLRNEVVSRVRLLAMELQLRQEEVQATTESLALLEQVRERILRRVEIGEAPRYDLIKADAEIITARQRVQQAALMVDQVRLSLDRLAAGTLPRGWTLGLDLGVDLLSLELPAVADGAPSRNPELLVLQQGLRQAQAQLEQARAGVLPSVDVLVSRGREPDARQQAVGLSLTVPLLDRRQGVISQAQVDLQRSRTALDGRSAELVQELRMARKSLEMALSRVRALSQGAIREAEAAVRVAEAAWRFGERGILDVLDAQRVLRALRADLIQARFEAQSALIDLDRLQGRHAQPLR